MNQYYLEPKGDYHCADVSVDSKIKDNDKLLSDTIKYYDDCHYDYFFAWCNQKNLALHYGYWPDDSQYQHHQALLNMNAVLYKTAAIKATDYVLDAGCGIGGSSIWMATEHQNKVTGITISQQQAESAQKYAKRRQIKHLVDFQVADYCQTSFEDESFDVIWALESACYALDKADFIREAYRLLRKGGRLVLCDAFMLRRNFSESEWQTVMTFLNGWRVPNLSDRKNFNQLLLNAGFSDIQCTDISREVLPSSKYMYKVSKRVYPIHRVSEYFGLRSKAQIGNYQVGFAQYDFFHEPLAEYCLFTAIK